MSKTKKQRVGKLECKGCEALRGLCEKLCDQRNSATNDYAAVKAKIDALRAEVERLRWRDAAEAPRDGTHFLAWSGGQTFNTHPPTVVHWFVDGFYTSVNEIEPERKFRVLWWMPLPDTPKESPCKP